MKSSKLRLILVVAIVALVLALSLQNALTSQLPPTQGATDGTPLPLLTAPPAQDEASEQSAQDTLETAPTGQDDDALDASEIAGEQAETLPEDGAYDQKDDVARYIHLYHRLPNNFITKNDARSLGWEGGSLEGYADGKCIGGDRFGNYEGLLPEKKGRSYTECDIDTMYAAERGAKRIVFSNDGLIYYTDDHYASFTKLYGEES